MVNKWLHESGTDYQSLLSQHNFKECVEGCVSQARAGRTVPRGGSVTRIEKWWAMTCTQCGGFNPIRRVAASERVPRYSNGTATCVCCHAPNVLAAASLFVIDGKRLGRIRLRSPVDYVK